VQQRLRPFRAALVIGLCLPLVACFEEPISEHVHLRLLADGHVVMTVVHEVTTGRTYGNDALADRLDQARDGIGRSLDPWSTRMAYVNPLAESLRFERLDGDLVRSVHSAVLPFEEAVQLLQGDGLTGSLQSTTEGRLAQFFPTGGSRATASQHQLVDERLAAWSHHVAAYLGAGVELYRYLEYRPDRGAACFAHVFDIWDEDDGLPPLDPQEEVLVAALKQTMEPVAEALVVPDGEAYSLNELSRLVFDPFPARLTVEVTGEVLSYEGFVASGPVFERPRVDAWNALRRLAGRWLAPDPITATVAPAAEEDLPEPDPTVFASRSRRFAVAPSVIEVQDALEFELAPAELVSIAWRPPVLPPAADQSESDWLAVIAAAESSLPD
jgi:hypothetical protein